MSAQTIITKAKFLKKELQKLLFKYKTKMNWFDISSNVDTGEQINREFLFDSIDSPNKQYMTRYVPTDINQLRKSLNQLLVIDRTLLNSTLIDFGCGKGRVLILADQMGFRKVIGVEFSKKLYEICINNLKRAKSSAVDVVHGDVLDYKILGDVRVFYFYNPFEYLLFEKMLNKIKNFLKTTFQTGYIIYIDPREFGQLDPNEYELVFKDDGPINPFHIYKVLL